MSNHPEWIKKITKLAEEVVLEGSTVEEDMTKEDSTGAMRLASVVLEKDSPARNRHVFILAVDTTDMKEEEAEGGRVVISGLKNNELMMGNADVVIACLIQFLKSKKARPFLVRALMQGLDLGGLERSIVPGNINQLMEDLMSANGNIDEFMTKMAADGHVTDAEQTKQ